MRVVLLGDSHLARVRRDAHLIADDVLNLAVGGATAADLPGQLAGYSPEPGDVVVVSIGTNDAAPWRPVTADKFATEVTQALTGLTQPLVIVRSPGCVESRLRAAGDRTNALLDEYAALLPQPTLDTPALLDHLGERAFDIDGLHLSGAGYAALLPAIREAVRVAARDDVNH